ncbi:ATP-binding cassette domain-containing protein [Planomonospora venezuelensis]|uniref:ABC-2 type transport system ATP-binding protein n=1 Tax=Planomonospora venezuelensis TaxID=1999 RepID=A0A841CYV9_PLAVE|nr:ABC transporter ATP-binding protein [Planomonospora venezuelensis]MBB5963181.1 ABC-2 type transport system ATP-binding protein [Planomonospora venezuelensis]GIN00058.1 ABC transporter [Planomonospora venezuelensis]
MKIDVNDLRVDYGDVRAIDGMTFSLDAGKIYGLLGRNGSGKTTLLSVLAGFRRESGGTVRVDGRPVFENGAVTGDVCLVRDAGETIGIGTVEDALYFAEWLRPHWDAAYADALLDRFGLRRKANVKTMSKGQRSALGVVVGLAGRSPLTMFDESYLGMDAPSRYSFYDALLADFMEHPRTVILSTHLIEEYSSLFEEVLIIDRGRLVLHEESQTVLARGTSVTGPAERVEAFTGGLTVLDTRRLGPTASAMVYGDLDDARRGQAREAGLELGPIAMQDLFVHLTEPAGDAAPAVPGRGARPGEPAAPAEPSGDAR